MRNEGSTDLSTVQKRVRTWEQVLGALSDPKTRSVARRHLWDLQNKRSGEGPETIQAWAIPPEGCPPVRGLWAPSAFTTSRDAKEDVCSALTYVEDWLSVVAPRSTHRRRISDTRRRLEDDLYETGYPVRVLGGER